MNERIIEIRKKLGLTQQEFADRIGSKRANIAVYESGRSEPSALAISSICREFHVNEEWLRTGTGEMFLQQSRTDAIRAFVDDLMTDQPDSFRVQFAAGLAKLTDHEWTVLANIAAKLAAENIAADPQLKDSDNLTGASVEDLEEEYKKRASGSASTVDSPASSSTGDASGVA